MNVGALAFCLVLTALAVTACGPLPVTESPTRLPPGPGAAATRVPTVTPIPTPTPVPTRPPKGTRPTPVAGAPTEVPPTVPPSTTTPRPVATPDPDLALANTEFEFNLFAELRKGSLDENVFISPGSRWNMKHRSRRR